MEIKVIGKIQITADINSPLLRSGTKKDLKYET